MKASDIEKFAAEMVEGIKEFTKEEPDQELQIVMGVFGSSGVQISYSENLVGNGLQSSLSRIGAINVMAGIATRQDFPDQPRNVVSVSLAELFGGAALPEGGSEPKEPTSH